VTAHLTAWQARHGISDMAMMDLMATLARGYSQTVSAPAGMSEAGVTSLVRMEAQSKGVLLFRNQVGAFEDKTGRWVRFGLANDSKAMNETLKSGDWIGIRPKLITPEMVGSVIGQFVSREIKEAGWTYSGKGREGAQNNWNALITSRGGDACFASGMGTL
jgi:hypothetical protein